MALFVLEQKQSLSSKGEHFINQRKKGVIAAEIGLKKFQNLGKNWIDDDERFELAVQSGEKMTGYASEKSA